MPRIGAHMSVAGGVSLAVDGAALHGREALQIFTKNGNQWQGKPLERSEVRRFRRRIEETGVTPVVSHASDLINLATRRRRSAPGRLPRSPTSSIAPMRSACSASSSIRAPAATNRRRRACGRSPPAFARY